MPWRCFNARPVFLGEFNENWQVNDRSAVVMHTRVCAVEIPILASARFTLRRSRARFRWRTEEDLWLIRCPLSI